MTAFYRTMQRDAGDRLGASYRLYSDGSIPQPGVETTLQSDWEQTDRLDPASDIEARLQQAVSTFLPRNSEKD